jgi:hypothetical protein
MAPDGSEYTRVTPRALMQDSADFSHNANGLWLPLAATPLEHVLGAYWHHLVACTVREKFAVQPVEELARSLEVTNLVYFRRQFTGEYRVSIEQLCLWAIALDDVSVLPFFESAAELFPPGLHPEGHVS